METTRILMVDDEEEATDLLSKRLSRRGFDCLTASSGEEALALLEREHVDIAILDVKMPGMGGLAALKSIKAQYPAIEVIMLSGHADPNSAVEGLRIGAFGYVMKPPDFNELLHLVEDARRMRDLG